MYQFQFVLTFGYVVINIPEINTPCRYFIHWNWISFFRLISRRQKIILFHLYPSKEFSMLIIILLWWWSGLFLFHSGIGLYSPMSTRIQEKNDWFDRIPRIYIMSYDGRRPQKFLDTTKRSFIRTVSHKKFEHHHKHMATKWRLTIIIDKLLCFTLCMLPNKSYRITIAS